MKKLALGIMALAISFATIAQSKEGRKNGHQKHADKEFKHQGMPHKNLKHLNLTDAQSTQLKAINSNFRDQMRTLQSDNTISNEVREQRKQALITDHKNQIHAILTPEQRKQWQSHSKQKNKRNKQ